MYYSCNSMTFEQFGIKIHLEKVQLRANKQVSKNSFN